MACRGANWTKSTFAVGNILSYVNECVILIAMVQICMSGFKWLTCEYDVEALGCIKTEYLHYFSDVRTTV
jgi:hypothetical protein